MLPNPFAPRSPRVPLPLLAFAVLGPWTAGATGDPGVFAAGTAPASARADDPILGPDLVIEGQHVQPAELRRVLVTGPLGSPLIDMRKRKIYIEEELAKRLREGKGQTDVRVTEKDFQDLIDQAEKEMEKQGLKLASFVDKNDPNYKEQVLAKQLFFKVFLPDNPYEYPDITLMAIEDATRESYKQAEE